MADVGMHNGARREMDISRRNQAGDSAENGKFVGDDGAFNLTGNSNDEIWCAHRANDLPVHVDWTAGGCITLDYKVLGENTLACV